ncbi:MAG: acetyltransferase [Cetobacterium sp.]
MIENLNKECICEELVIIGAGGFGREVLWLIDDINEKQKRWNVVGFIDEDKSLHGKYINGHIVLGGFDYFEKNKNIKYVCAIGNASIRKKIIQEKCSGLVAANLVHPSVIMSKIIEIGNGVIICAGSILTVNLELGNHVIINLNCTIGHDAILKDFVTVYPNVNVSGNCIIGECSEIGTGTKIIQGKKLGENTIVGAGSVVVKNIEGNCTVVGIPARKIK